MAMPVPTRVVTYGASRVGVLSTMVLAYHNQGINFTVVDDDATLIQAWNNRQNYKPGLNQLGHLANIKFTSEEDDINQALLDAHVIFLAVEKPIKAHGIGKNIDLDLGKWVKAVERIRSVTFQLGPKRIVERFPIAEVGTNYFVDLLQPRAQGQEPHQLFLNPVFSRGGYNMVDDLLNPAHILIAPKFPSNADTTFFNNCLYQWAADVIEVSDSKTVESTMVAKNYSSAMQLLDLNVVKSMAGNCGVNIDDVFDILSYDKRLAPGIKAFVGAGQPGIGEAEIERDILCFAKLARDCHQDKIYKYCKSAANLAKEYR